MMVAAAGSQLCRCRPPTVHGLSISCAGGHVVERTQAGGSAVSVPGGSWQQCNTEPSSGCSGSAHGAMEHAVVAETAHAGSSHSRCLRLLGRFVEFGLFSCYSVG